MGTVGSDGRRKADSRRKIGTNSLFDRYKSSEKNREKIEKKRKNQEKPEKKKGEREEERDK